MHNAAVAMIVCMDANDEHNIPWGMDNFLVSNWHHEIKKFMSTKLFMGARHVRAQILISAKRDMILNIMASLGASVLKCCVCKSCVLW